MRVKCVCVCVSVCKLTRIDFYLILLYFLLLAGDSGAESPAEDAMDDNNAAGVAAADCTFGDDGETMMMMMISQRERQQQDWRGAALISQVAGYSDRQRHWCADKEAGLPPAGTATRPTPPPVGRPANCAPWPPSTTTAAAVVGTSAAVVTASDKSDVGDGASMASLAAGAADADCQHKEERRVMTDAGAVTLNGILKGGKLWRRSQQPRPAADKSPAVHFFNVSRDSDYDADHDASSSSSSTTTTTGGSGAAANCSSAHCQQHNSSRSHSAFQQLFPRARRLLQELPEEEIERLTTVARATTNRQDLNNCDFNARCVN